MFILRNIGVKKSGIKANKTGENLQILDNNFSLTARTHKRENKNRKKYTRTGSINTAGKSSPGFTDAT
jgi:hypothetical protein